MKTYDFEFTVRITARRDGTDLDEALEDLLTDLEMFPGVCKAELMDVCDSSEVNHAKVDC